MKRVLQLAPWTGFRAPPAPQPPQGWLSRACWGQPWALSNPRVTHSPPQSPQDRSEQPQNSLGGGGSCPDLPVSYSWGSQPTPRKWIPLPNCSLPPWVAGHGWIIQNNSFLAGSRRGRGTQIPNPVFLSNFPPLLGRGTPGQTSGFLPPSAWAPNRYGGGRLEAQIC